MAVTLKDIHVLIRGLKNKDFYFERQEIYERRKKDVDKFISGLIGGKEDGEIQWNECIKTGKEKEKINV